MGHVVCLLPDGALLTLRVGSSWDQCGVEDGARRQEVLESKNWKGMFDGHQQVLLKVLLAVDCVDLLCPEEEGWLLILPVELESHRIRVFKDE